jgi:pimeloyl-ACP methyl ester carboxylesterase
MSATPTLLSLHPNLTLACRAFAIPSRVPATVQERQALDKGSHGRLKYDQEDIAYWTFGKGPKVLLVHGWCSRGSHLLGFVKPLVASGFTAVIFDAPGHGDSAGSASSVIHAGRAALALAKHLGKLEGVVGHSAGSMAALWAFNNGMSVEKSVHIAGPSSLNDLVQGIAKVHMLDEDRSSVLASWTENFMSIRIVEANLPALSASLSHPGLVIHDMDDRVVPYEQSLSLHRAWKQSELKSVHNLGHIRILADTDTIAATVAHVTRTA